MYYIYVYLDPRKMGSFVFEKMTFEYEPFYVGKGKGTRYLDHLRIAKGDRKGKINLVVAKIKSILNDGYEPVILKVYDGLTNENYNQYEIDTIKTIGRLSDNTGTLLNITEGGDGGITWVGDHHNKNKRIEEIVGADRAREMKSNLSRIASQRIGTRNPNYGNRGEKNPMYGRKTTAETKEKIRQKTLVQFSKYSDDEIMRMVEKMIESKKEIPDHVKQKWYTTASSTLKEKLKNGELFKPEHREKLKKNNFKKLNKGSDLLKISDDVKMKISKSLKGRRFSEEHLQKLRKCISFEQFEIDIVELINKNIIKNITGYRKYAKSNPDLKYPMKPEWTYRKNGWSGWRKYGM